MSQLVISWSRSSLCSYHSKYVAPFQRQAHPQCQAWENWYGWWYCHHIRFTSALWKWHSKHYDIIIRIIAQEPLLFLWTVTFILHPLFQEAFRAFHNNPAFVRKYMRAIHIGRVRNDEPSEAEPEAKRVVEIKQDFEKLRQTAHKMVSASCKRATRLLAQLLDFSKRQGFGKCHNSLWVVVDKL